MCLSESSLLFSTQGDFKEGIMHGRGIFTWTDGLIYEVCHPFHAMMVLSMRYMYVFMCACVFSLY